MAGHADDDELSGVATAAAEAITAPATSATLRHFTRAVPHPGKLLVASRHISARLYAEHVPLPRIKLDEQPVDKIITGAYEARCCCVGSVSCHWRPRRSAHGVRT